MNATTPGPIRLSQFMAANSLPMPMDVSVAGNVAMIALATVADLEMWGAQPIGVTRCIEGKVIGNRSTPLWLYRFDDLDGLCGWMYCEVAEACGRCRRPFDPADKRHDGAARYAATRWCRGCIDRCHESTEFDHSCQVCTEAVSS